MNSKPCARRGTLLLISPLFPEKQKVHLILSTYGYRIHDASIGTEGLRLLFTLKPDLVLLDDALPDISSEALWLRIRNFTTIPIIFLGKQKSATSIHALANDGNTDYLSKPLQPALLVAHVEQALQTQSATNHAAPSMIELIVDHRHYQVILNSKLSPLSAAEYQLLCYLLHNPSQLLSHQQILKELWGAAIGNRVNQLHTLVWRLRRKIEQNPRRPNHLLSHYGVGYSFDRQGIVEYNA